MNNQYQTIEITADQFYGAAANFSTGRVTRGRSLANFTHRSQGRAITLNPYSEIRACVVFLDGDTIGQPLLPGGVIVGPFQTFSVAPVLPCTFAPDRCALPTGSAPDPAPLVSPSVLRLDVYREAIPVRVQSAMMLSIQQFPIDIHNPVAGNDYTLMAFSAPGLRSIRIWASNENHLNPDPLTISLLPTRSEMKDQRLDEPRTVLTGRSDPALATMTLPAAADGEQTVTIAVVDPGDFEYAVNATVGGAATVGDYRVTVGAELTFYQGAP